MQEGVPLLLIVYLFKKKLKFEIDINPLYFATPVISGEHVWCPDEVGEGKQGNWWLGLVIHTGWSNSQEQLEATDIALHLFVNFLKIWYLLPQLYNPIFVVVAFLGFHMNYMCSNKWNCPPLADSTDVPDEFYLAGQPSVSRSWSCFLYDVFFKINLGFLDLEATN